MSRITKERDSIFTDLVTSQGANEKSEVYMVTDVKSGTSELVISKTIIEHYPVQELDKVMNLYEKLNRGNGRKIHKLKDLI